MTENAYRLAAVASLNDVSNSKIDANRSGKLENRISMRSDVTLVDFTAADNYLILEINARIDYANVPPSTPSEQIEPESLFPDGRGDIGYVKLTTEATFRLPEDFDDVEIDEESVRSFYDTSALFIVYPYIRSAVEGVSNMMSLPRTTLPLLKRDIE